VQGIGRLAAWNFKAPTGIPQGYDAADLNGVPGTPTSQEIAESVAATLYNVWRSEFIRNTVDADERHMDVRPRAGQPFRR
jgi:penicillin amidase